jgi:hypothetical protein
VVRLIGISVLCSLATQGSAKGPEGWQVLKEDATGYGTRTFLPSSEPRPLSFFERNYVVFEPPGGGDTPTNVGYQPMPPSAARIFRNVGAAEGLEIFETGIPCTHDREICSHLILAGPSEEALRPIYTLGADPSLVGRIDPSEIFSSRGRTFLRISSWGRGAGYAGYREEYWLLRGGLPVDLRLSSVMKHGSVFVVTAGRALVSVDPSPRDGSSQTQGHPGSFQPRTAASCMFVWFVLRGPLKATCTHERCACASTLKAVDSALWVSMWDLSRSR